MKISRKQFLSFSLVSTSALFLGSLISCKKQKPKSPTYLRLKNKDNPSELEQKHVPAVTAPEKVKANEQFDVSVKVGFSKDHPSTKDHWIRYIKLTVDGKEVAKKDFPAGGTQPKATFKIALNKASQIEAIIDCNLHGIWISEPSNIAIG